MTRTRAFGIAGAALIALASVHAWAQPPGEASAASNGTAVAASGGMTAKDIRKANRALRRTVYAAIVKHKEINAGDISVVAKSGAVTLDGTVVDASQIDKVAEIARGVPGVTSVTNRLTVQKPFGGQ
ncbi:BON domain-containing protein [Paraburkholderia sp. LEh10]|uniref:BON domain-containing protein n=1 Tax=Paraburkholderia sp. LEh10 TaxID=2821353 RepID=UPI001AE8072B|nr:BON domain-containing protein [Paraburkholderia sp. LEh10]MBP0595471.1 BON domain-containing protein [Paraburkholderia sp. LEh10]